LNYAPIALFVYKRLEHTKKTILSLQKNHLASDSHLVIFSDYAKTSSELDEVLAVRKFCKEIKGFKTIKIIERDRNYGLSKSIISGVTELLSSYDRVIVMEDDLVASPFFLKFMNDGLTKYSEEYSVISVHGYIYPTANPLPNNFFLKGADCWGWATWRRGWELFIEDGLVLLGQLKHKKLESEFDFNGAYPFSKMLKDQIRGRNDSWAVRWYASAFLQSKLTLYPGKSLIQNIGFDGNGSHCSPTKIFDVNMSSKPIEIEGVPVVSSELAYKEFEKFHRASKRSIPFRLIGKIRMILARWLPN
jgi:hypothetical protein